MARPENTNKFREDSNGTKVKHVLDLSPRYGYEDKSLALRSCYQYFCVQPGNRLANRVLIW